MQHFFRLMTLWLVALVFASPSHAGWRLDHYEVIKNSSSQTITSVFKQNANGTAGVSSQVKNSENPKPLHYVSNGGSGNLVSGRTYYFSRDGGHMVPYGDVPLADGSVAAIMSIVAVFKWEGSESETPSKEFLISESSQISAGVMIGGARALNIEQAQTGLSDGKVSVSSGYGFNKRQFTQTTISSEGRREVHGPSRTLIIQAQIPGYSHNQMYQSYPDRVAEVQAEAYYSAEIADFEIGVSAPNMEWIKLNPRDKEINGYASREWKDATHFDWVGTATYSASLSQSLKDELGAVNYHWDDSGTWGDGTGNTDGQSSITRKYKFGSDGPFGGSQMTSAKVIVQANDGEIGNLKGTAKINWYEMPYTEYRAEVVTEVIDHNTGTTSEIESVMAGGNPLETEEERYLDEFTADYGAMKTEFVQTGAQLVGSALEVEMMVGSWFVPDEIDVATAGAGLVVKPFTKLFKVGRTLKASFEVGARITRVRSKLAGAVPAITRKLGHGNFTIIMKRKKYRVSRKGHVGPNGQRVEAPMGELNGVEDELCRIPGGSCFVKGTLVATQNGLRAIETLQAQELVWSRDESTGETQLKPIVQTFERYSATLALTFSNGETIETTSEHPFYVVGRGFVKAGELGIGTSIVTRAGPTVQVVAATSGKAQTVYNFEVADFHTYFVGQGEVWVHNRCIKEEADDLAAKIFRTRRTDAEDAGFFTEPDLSDYINIFTQMNSDAGRKLSGDREAWLDEGRNIIIIVNRDPAKRPGTVIFKNDSQSARDYFDTLV